MEDPPKDGKLLIAISTLSLRSESSQVATAKSSKLCHTGKNKDYDASRFVPWHERSILFCCRTSVKSLTCLCWTTMPNVLLQAYGVVLLSLYPRI